jgi:hypothetical protein
MPVRICLNPQGKIVFPVQLSFLFAKINKNPNPENSGIRLKSFICKGFKECPGRGAQRRDAGKRGANM